MKQVVAALIIDGDKILICQRTRHQPMPLKWEFPGGKVEPEERPEDALRRELEEELGFAPRLGQRWLPSAIITTMARPLSCTSTWWSAMRAKSRIEFSVMSGGRRGRKCWITIFSKLILRSLRSWQKGRLEFRGGAGLWVEQAFMPA